MIKKSKISTHQKSSLPRGKAVVTAHDMATAACSKYHVLAKAMEKCGDDAYSIASQLARFINAAILAHNIQEAKSALQLADRFFTHADSKLKNAFECDFCEVLDLRGDSGRDLFEGLTEPLKALYCKAQNYLGQPYKA